MDYSSPKKKTGKQIQIDSSEVTDNIGRSGDLDHTLTEEGIITSRRELESEDGLINKGRRNTTSVSK